jgi:acetyltransferase-like isoleucine patch superfamily enzyme
VTPRLFVRRVGNRIRHELAERDFFNQALINADALRARGAHIGQTGFLSFLPFVDGPPELLDVGEHVGWGEDVLFLTRDLAPVPYLGVRREAPIRLVKYIELGHRCVIKPGVSIGPRAAVVGGAVVERDVPFLHIASGNPARSAQIYPRWYRSRLHDIRTRPELYRERGCYTVDQPPTPDLPLEGVRITRDLERGPDMSGLRRTARRAIEWVARQLEEQDELELSRDRVRLLRKGGTRIGEECFIAADAWIDPRAGAVSIGDHCIVGRRAVVLAHDGFAQGYTGLVRVEAVHILDGCVLEPGCMVVPGVTIGPGSIVRAGSVVTADVPPQSVVAGSPAPVVGTTQEWVRQVEAARQAHPEQYVEDNRVGRYTLPPAEREPRTLEPRAETASPQP